MITRSKLLVWTFPILSIVATAFGYLSIVESQPERALVTPATRPAEPRRSDSSVIAALGIVEPSDHEIEIGTLIPGIVEAVKVSPGDTVTAGAPLFAIDSRLVREEIEIRKAEVAVAEAKLEEAQVNAADLNDQYDRVAHLSVGRSVSDSTVTRRRYAAHSADALTKVAQQTLESYRAQLHATQVFLKTHTVRSPVDATVLQVNVRPGEYAQIGSVAKGMIVLGRLGPLQARVQIDESEIGRFSPGMHGYASPRSQPEQRWELHFVRVEPVVAPKKSLDGSVVERTDTRTLDVVYKIESSAHSLYVGQQLDVYLESAPVAEN
jgi:HlyD family secretion protein